MALTPIDPPSDQYRDSANLSARGRLHARYGTKNWFSWLAGHVNLAAGARVLDIGCGAGWFWQQAAAALPPDMHLTLTDRSAGMVEEAVGRLQVDAGFGHVDGYVADAGALPFSDACFDAVFAMHVLYHVADPAIAFGEIARVLRHGGKAFVTTNGTANMKALFDLGHQAYGGPVEDPAATVFDLEWAKALLAGHFPDVTLIPFLDLYRCTDPIDVFDYLTSFPPGSEGDPDSRNTLQRLIDDSFRDGDGMFRVERESGLLIASAA